MSASFSSRAGGNHAPALRGRRFVAAALLFTSLLVQPHRSARAEADSATATPDDKAAALLRDYRGDVVLIKGKAGAGSGFIINLKGRKFLASNAHVLAGVRAPTFAPLDRSLLKLKPGAASVAVGHDIILLEVLEGGTGMPLVESFETEVKVNDAIAVYGNTGGGDVVTVIKGKLLGLGPDRIEINAAIEHGNSGSPIIHERTGKVIGIATYATTDDLLSGEQQVRRFGYRLDSVKQWQAVDWARFYAEADQLEKMQATTTDLKKAFLELNGLNLRRTKARKFAYETLAIREALDKFFATVVDAQSQADANRARNNLLGALRGATQPGPTTPKPTFQYEHFRRQSLAEENDRGELLKGFGRILQP